MLCSILVPLASLKAIHLLFPLIHPSSFKRQILSTQRCPTNLHSNSYSPPQLPKHCHMRNNIATRKLVQLARHIKRHQRNHYFHFDYFMAPKSVNLTIKWVLWIDSRWSDFCDLEELWDFLDQLLFPSTDTQGWRVIGNSFWN